MLQLSPYLRRCTHARPRTPSSPPPPRTRTHARACTHPHPHARRRAHRHVRGSGPPRLEIPKKKRLPHFLHLARRRLSPLCPSAAQSVRLCLSACLSICLCLCVCRSVSPVCLSVCLLLPLPFGVPFGACLSAWHPSVGQSVSVCLFCLSVPPSCA